MTESKARRVFILIPDDYPAGGLQRSAMAVRDCLEERGYDVTVYCMRLDPGGFAEKHPFVRAVSPIRRTRATSWLTFFSALRSHLRREKPVAAIGLGVIAASVLPI